MPISDCRMNKDQRKTYSLCLVFDASAPQAIARTAAAVRKGAVVAFPSETVYGLAVRPGDRAARERLIRIKGREGKKPFQVLVSSRSAALRMCGSMPVCGPARRRTRSLTTGRTGRALRKA